VGPKRVWDGPEKSRSTHQTREKLFAEGKISKAENQAAKKGFQLASRYFDCRNAPGSIMGETLLGIAKGVKTVQDDLPLTEKVSADWVRVPHKLEKEADHVAALAAILDMAMSFLPLTHDGKFLDEVGANSSLDFAMRLFVNGFNVNEWHLREFTAVVGAEGRVYNESRVYDPTDRMVATMSQQAIMRPKPPAKI
jgi:acyl-CoA thioesterase